MPNTFRQRRPWPADLHYEDVKTERVIEQHLPTRPVVIAHNSTGAMCAEAQFAEGEVADRAGLSPAA
jgi:hypothetical protein